MPRKQQKPDSNTRPSRVKNREVIFFRVPKPLKDAIKKACAHETRTRRHKVEANEWLMRAAIDRLGEIYGTSVAKHFYRQYFNGLAAVDLPVEITEAAGDDGENKDS